MPANYNMPVGVIKQQSNVTFRNRRENDALIQDLIIAASYHALCGNSDPLNDILADAVASNTTKIQGLLLWVRQNLPIGMKEGKFKLNKDWTKAQVTSYPEFEKNVLHHLKQAAKWWELAPKTNAQSEWDGDKYLNSVIDTLRKHGQDEAANQVLAAKAKLKAA